MSKLDDILNKHSPISSSKWNNETKQQIKDLIQELFDEVLLHGHPQSALEAYDDLRQKVNEL